MEYKDKVKFVRQRLMLSQADFAKKLGVAFSTVNEWENGVRHPNYIMQRKFAAFCEENNIVFNDWRKEMTMADEKNPVPEDNQGDIVIYQTEDGGTKIDVRFEGETMWLTQQQMAELFGSSRLEVLWF